MSNGSKPYYELIGAYDGMKYDVEPGGYRLEIYVYRALEKMAEMALQAQTVDNQVYIDINAMLLLHTTNKDNLDRLVADLHDGQWKTKSDLENESSIPSPSSSESPPEPEPVSIPEPVPSPTPTPTTEVTGILSGDTVLTKESSPYLITDTVQVPPNVTLTIEPGVAISKPSSGDMFLLMGKIYAHGTSQEPIVFDGGGNSKIIYTQPGYGYGDFQYCTIQNGYDFWDRWGHLNLMYSTIINLSRGSNKPIGGAIIHFDSPTAMVNIEYNKFINTGGITTYDDHYGMNIRYNQFQGLLSPITHAGGGTPSNPPKKMIVNYNSFIEITGLALSLEPGFIGWSPSIDATENYWGTQDTNIIGQMIHDNNDDITIENIIGYLPILTEPHPSTPD